MDWGQGMSAEQRARETGYRGMIAQRVTIERAIRVAWPIMERDHRACQIGMKLENCAAHMVMYNALITLQEFSETLS